MIKQLDNDVPVVPKIRLSGDNVFKKNIRVPIPLTVMVTFLCIYFMLVMQTTVNYLEMAGVFVALLSIFAFVIFYFKYEASKINLDSIKVLIISFITVVSLLSFQVYTSLMSQISFPLSAFTVLLALLVSVRVSVVYTFTMVIFFILINDFSIIVPLFHIAGGLVSVINVRKIRSRTGFTRVGINIFFAMLVPLIVFYFFNVLTLDETIENIAYVAMNAALSVLVILAPERCPLL
ncbi:MAG: hypothetical protein II090_03930, partial [Elusimicrobia bacterium]|nr:hypothetical protein [Elusimicrobiota bacterium]